MKMFMHSLYGDARQWYFSLPPSNISSLKDFHRLFNEHCKRFFPDKVLFDNCCVEYELHKRVEDVNMEEYFSQNLHHLSNNLHCDMSPYKHELERTDEEAEGFPITSISDFHESEELDSLATHADDTQFPDLQIMGICSNLEQQDFQRLSYLQLEYQRHSSSYEYVISNYDKEGDVEISESLLSTRTLSNSIFQKTDDHKCAHVVIDAFCFSKV